MCRVHSPDVRNSALSWQRGRGRLLALVPPAAKTPPGTAGPMQNRFDGVRNTFVTTLNLNLDPAEEAGQVAHSHFQDEETDA